MSPSVPSAKLARNRREGSLRQQAYDAVKAMILAGELRSGEHLHEVKLSARLGVSRTPLREAFMLLEKEGLVSVRPGNGYIVTHADFTTICELLVVREGLDSYAAELAAESADEEDFEKLQAVLREIEALGQARSRAPEHIARELELGLKVHEIILSATKNRVLEDLTRRVYDQIRQALWLEVFSIDLWDEAIEEHRAIIDALLARDAKQAASAARRHVHSSLENIKKLQAIQLLLPR